MEESSLRTSAEDEQAYEQKNERCCSDTVTQVSRLAPSLNCNAPNHRFQPFSVKRARGVHNAYIVL